MKAIDAGSLRGRTQCARFQAAPIAALVISFSVFAFCGAQTSQAAMFAGLSSDGHPVSATADFSSVGDVVTVKLTNTTATTLDAGELFTGLVFSISGLTPTLTSKTAVERTVAGDGSYVDGGGPVDISWSLDNLGGGMWRLDFNPDAMHAILGPPFGGGSNYAGSNSSVRGNPGHNPFSAEMAVFTLSVPGFSSAPLPSVDVKAFLFGTNLDPATGIIIPGGGPEVPEPASVVLVLAAAVGLGFRRRR